MTFESTTQNALIPKISHLYHLFEQSRYFLLLIFRTNSVKSPNDWSHEEQRIFFPSNLNVSLDFISGNNIYCSPRDQSLSVKYLICWIPFCSRIQPSDPGACL